MGKLVPLHEATALTLPLSDGACVRVTPFRESARVAVSIHGPGGGDAGGVVLGPHRARLLASWLLRMADDCERHGHARRTPVPATPVRRRRAVCSGRPAPAPAR